MKEDKFIELVKKYTVFSELTPQMIAEYIEKIVEHERINSTVNAINRWIFTSTLSANLKCLRQSRLPKKSPQRKKCSANGSTGCRSGGTG